MAPSVTCSTTSVSRWLGPSNPATPTSHAPSPPGSDGSGTWAAASTTPGDGSQRLCHCGESMRPSRPIRALAWGGLVGMVYDTELAMEHGAEAVARARALGDASTLALATMLHASAIYDFFHRTAPATELAEESRHPFESVGDGWSRAMATLVGGEIFMVHADYDAALAELRRSCGGVRRQRTRVGPRPRAASCRRHRDDARRLRRSRARAAARDLGLAGGRSRCHFERPDLAPGKRVCTPGPDPGRGRLVRCSDRGRRAATQRADSRLGVQPAWHHAATPRACSTKQSAATARRSRSMSNVARPPA